VLIPNAYAQSGGSTEQQLISFLPLILMFVVLYFLMIRPQMKRAKDHKSMLDGLSKGDEVITAGGLVGRVLKLGDSFLTLEVGQRDGQSVEMHVQKQSVQTLLPKGTIKAL
jgi:preprotein translocase subunit YajC